MGEHLDLAAYRTAVRSWTRTAFRMETRAAYDVGDEAELFDRFVAGERVDPTEVPSLREWYARVREHAAAGRVLSRVRIFDTPPTDYQRYEAWCSRWNVEAGEQISGLARTRAAELGVPTDTDWWLLDDDRVIRMLWDGDRLTGAVLLTDEASVVDHRAWRDVAVRSSAPIEAGHIAM